MASARAAKVALVVKQTAWSRYLEDQDERVKELLERQDPVVAHVRSAHEEHEQTAAEVLRELTRLGVEVVRVAGKRDPFETDDLDLVVTVGGDGTLLGTSHRVGGMVPVLGINSAPSRSVGFFCGARPGEAGEALSAALSGELQRVVLTRMQVSINDRVVHRRVLNDTLFCDACPAATSRYILELDDQSEEQKSSGFWIGPAAGSTAAQRAAGGQVLPLTSPDLQLVVREPYTPHAESYRFAQLQLRPDQKLLVRNKNWDARVFLDGHEDVETLALGDVVEFSQSPEPLHLLGMAAERTWRG